MECCEGLTKRGRRRGMTAGEKEFVMRTQAKLENIGRGGYKA
ncbi:Hypothetical protein DEACI_3468 [Acididesulfobacillus acetoxydans]|uniref:Uncharacterized protein n=1 Tax=Acididesulfobacillus acetoxydans TaxID=1561005 RepID=A0A8S0W9Q6_9FIRM|nr:Hypothetical protein DEACI_3468 [Acididesulfobacillus acetoxydans]CEJ06354.1 Hypothetical protein DEACI_0802 [Acididesulfobacillus acetoxydans]